MPQDQAIYKVSVYEGWTVADELQEHADRIRAIVIGDSRLTDDDANADLAQLIRNLLGDVEEVRVSDVDGVRHIEAL